MSGTLSSKLAAAHFCGSALWPAADIPCLLMPSSDLGVDYDESGLTHPDLHINYQGKY